eukprot:9620927-Ditylum_brightwellii.AAC.1
MTIGCGSCRVALSHGLDMPMLRNVLLFAILVHNLNSDGEHIELLNISDFLRSTGSDDQYLRSKEHVLSD